MVEPSGNWWRRPVTLAAAAGLVAGVVIGGAGHSLPAASTRPMTAPAVLPIKPRPAVTVTATVAGPTSTVIGPVSTVTAIRTVTRTVSAVPARPITMSTAISTSTPAGPAPTGTSAVSVSAGGSMPVSPPTPACTGTAPGPSPCSTKAPVRMSVG